MKDPDLLRIRELAIQAANGALSDSNKIHDEVDHIKQSINEIANNTYFNGIRVLNNEAGTGSW
ncbi:hypothetical protein MKX68_07435 [Paenibacillus sp. FSL M8-0212]|uniref:flagellin N-terminal helical domain-containing protein n=1 Tax=Paenibacillus sp. FSL M8-0212 TaxID=2921618 RepID=UPI0030F74A5A